MAFVNTTIDGLTAVKANIETVSKNADYVRILLDSDNILIDRIEMEWFIPLGIDETFSEDYINQSDNRIRLLFAYHGIAMIYQNISNDLKEPDAFERLSDKYFRESDTMFESLKKSGFPYDFQTIDETLTPVDFFSVDYKLVKS